MGWDLGSERECDASSVLGVCFCLGDHTCLCAQRTLLRLRGRVSRSAGEGAEWAACTPGSCHPRVGSAVGGLAVQGCPVSSFLSSGQRPRESLRLSQGHPAWKWQSPAPKPLLPASPWLCMTSLTSHFRLIFVPKPGAPSSYLQSLGRRRAGGQVVQEGGWVLSTPGLIWGPRCPEQGWHHC